MGQVHDPQGRSVNPDPGGKTDTATAPPYEGRTSSADQTESQRAQGDSVERQMTDTVSRGDAEIGQVKSPGGTNIDPATGEEGRPISEGEVSHRTPDDPYGVGTSASRPGETYGKPATEHKGKTERPVGQVEGDLMEPNNSASGTKDPAN